MLENQLSRYGAITRGVSFNPCGRVFFAVNPLAEHIRTWLTTEAAGNRNPADWHAVVFNEFPVDKDGVVRMHSTIQGAVDATIGYNSNASENSGRGDTVLVGPGKWKEEVKVIGKIGLRIIGCGYGSGSDHCRIRASDATTHYPFTTVIGYSVNGACFHVLSRGVEITGFYLDGGGDYAGIYAGGGLGGGITGYTTENASGLYVHDCFFRGGNEGSVGLDMDGPRFGCKIENNYFERWSGAAIEISAGNANCENALIQNNVFAASNGGYGIDIYGAANVKTACIRTNVFCDGVSAAFAAGVYTRAGATGVTSVVGNWFACATPLNLLSTDYHCGNFKGNATATEEYVSESATP